MVGSAWLNGVQFVSRAVHPDPQDVAIVTLDAQTSSLGLPNGTQNSLNSKLQAAVAAVQRGNTNAAANQLNAFINQLQAQAGKEISASSAAALSAPANAIIATR